MLSDGERVKAWRTAYNLTQRQAAELVGVDPNTWARWERNERETPAPVHRLLIVLSQLWVYEPAYWRPWWQPN